jgi:signal transduction histidine kinase
MRPTRSLRSQVVIGASLAAVVILLGSSLLTFTLMRSALQREFDATLIAQARALTALAVRNSNRLILEYDAYLMPEYIRDTHPDVFCFWDRHGQVLLRSPGLAGGDLLMVDGSLNAPEVRDTVLPDGRPARIVGFTFSPRRIGSTEHAPSVGRTLRVAAARDTIELQSQLLELKTILIAAATFGSLASLLTMAWLSRRLLRPLDQLAERIATIKTDQPILRLGDLPLPSELAPVRARLDELLDRLQVTLQRERTFTADAAHELRTPLAGLRTTLEVALSRVRTVADYRQAIDESLDISTQMQALVDNLLALARVEAGQVLVEREPTQLAPLIEQCWNTIAGRAEARGLRRTISLTDIDVVTIDRAKVRLVLTNLFDNAVTYTDTGGDIAISGTGTDGRLELQISNSGCTLPASAANQVFARFWRGDLAHTTTGLHCGLGLALCQTLIEVHGGHISAKIADGRFTILVDLPHAS